MGDLKVYNYESVLEKHHLKLYGLSLALYILAIV